MKILSNINYYYHQIATSTIIRKSTELTSAVAFYTFHGIKRIAALPAAPISSMPDLIFFPLLTGDAVSRMMEQWDRRISRPASPHFLERMIQRIDFIANWMFEKLCYLSLTVPLYPYRVISKGADYIEDITTQMSQKALNAMHIPVQLSISQRKLQSILEEWENRDSLGEDREKARKVILSFYEQSRSLISNLRSPAKSLSLENCQLRDLPDIFQYKPFLTLTSLNLSGNQLIMFSKNIGMLQKLKHLVIFNNNLSTIPTPLTTLPKTCVVYADIHKFPPKEIARISTYIDQANYTGPRIHSFDLLKRALLFAENSILLYRITLQKICTHIAQANYKASQLTSIKKELIVIEKDISLLDSLPLIKWLDHSYAIYTALNKLLYKVDMNIPERTVMLDNYEQFLKKIHVYEQFLTVSIS